MKVYRDNGAIGALLDEYEKSVEEMIDVIRDINTGELQEIADPDTTSSCCKSVQTVLSHVINAGHWYIKEIRSSLKQDHAFEKTPLLPTIEENIAGLRKMFTISEQVFLDNPDLKLVEKDNSRKIVVRWGQTYDVEQLLEHAIVHILRHRRQIERFLLKLRMTTG